MRSESRATSDHRRTVRRAAPTAASEVAPRRPAADSALRWLRTVSSDTSKATSGGGTGTPQCNAHADRADELPLDRTGVATLGGDFQKRAEPDEVVTPQVGDDRRRCVEPGDVDSDRAVLAERDTCDTDQCLGDRRLGRRPSGQAGDRRNVVRRQGELDGLNRVAVRQAADPGGRTRFHDVEHRQRARQKTRRPTVVPPRRGFRSLPCRSIVAPRPVTMTISSSRRDRGDDRGWRSRLGTPDCRRVNSIRLARPVGPSCGLGCGVGARRKRDRQRHRRPSRRHRCRRDLGCRCNLADRCRGDGDPGRDQPHRDTRHRAAGDSRNRGGMGVWRLGRRGRVGGGCGIDRHRAGALGNDRAIVRAGIRLRRGGSLPAATAGRLPVGGGDHVGRVRGERVDRPAVDRQGWLAARWTALGVRARASQRGRGRAGTACRAVGW